MQMLDHEHKSATNCFVKTIKHEGLRKLYKGWVPAYMRLGPQTLLTFVSWSNFASAYFDSVD
ncbi:hypothetical protein CCR75_006406 [Bremia lactucae]|uniref:Uncharacterized protein n=1 Tax=Bremia lactucae TaxID=4779 RepID=A0A976IKF3_BRELC|nr:hypothetical protein CCR75_006406 [Bremia lactucae]